MNYSDGNAFVFYPVHPVHPVKFFFDKSGDSILLMTPTIFSSFILHPSSLLFGGQSGCKSAIMAAF
ncbi:MAG TPA: hypothetical protein VF553_15700 [Pyrinomonadaceae bacterium]|jgi:hypothetical protein